MPDGGMARSVEMRIFLAFMMSSSRSADAGAAAIMTRPHSAAAAAQQCLRWSFLVLLPVMILELPVPTNCASSGVVGDVRIEAGPVS